MSRFYTTSQGEYIDFIHETDWEKELAAKESSVALDAEKKALQAYELPRLKTFEGWQPGMDSALSKLDSDVDDLVTKIVSDPNDPEAMGTMKTLRRDIKDQYSSGEVGKMRDDYDSYITELKRQQGLVKGEKDISKRANMQKTLNEWQKSVINRVGDQYSSDFYMQGMNPFISAPELLRDNVKTENLKFSFQSLGKPSIYTDGRLQNVSDSEIRTDASGNSYVVRVVKDEETGENVEKKFRVFDSEQDQVEKLMTEKGRGIPFQYDRKTYTREGFYQDMIKNLSMDTLYSDRAYIGMLQDRFQYYGEGERFLERYNKANNTNLTLEDPEVFEAYINQNASQEAQTYANQFAERTKTEVSTETFTDQHTSDIVKMNHKQKLKKDYKTWEDEQEKKKLNGQSFAYSVSNSVDVSLEPEKMERALTLISHKQQGGKLSAADQVELNNILTNYGSLLDPEISQQILGMSSQKVKDAFESAKTDQDKTHLLMQAYGSLKTWKDDRNSGLAKVLPNWMIDAFGSVQNDNITLTGIAKLTEDVEKLFNQVTSPDYGATSQRTVHAYGTSPHSKLYFDLFRKAGLQSNGGLVSNINGKNSFGKDHKKVFVEVDGDEIPVNNVISYVRQRLGGSDEAIEEAIREGKIQISSSASDYNTLDHHLTFSPEFASELGLKYGEGGDVEGSLQSFTFSDNSVTSDDMQTLASGEHGSNSYLGGTHGKAVRDLTGFLLSSDSAGDKVSHPVYTNKDGESMNIGVSNNGDIVFSTGLTKESVKLEELMPKLGIKTTGNRQKDIRKVAIILNRPAGQQRLKAYQKIMLDDSKKGTNRRVKNYKNNWKGSELLDVSNQRMRF